MEKMLSSPFGSFRKAYEGQKDFDTTYKSIKIVDVVNKTGEGEEDFIVVKKVIVDESLIRDVIDADKDSVGVDNIIKQVLRTGDSSLLPVDKGSGELVDLVDAPQSLMDVKNMGIKAEETFSKLPKELTEGLDMTTFVNSMSQEKFDAFVQAITDRANPKKGDVENE